MGFVEFGSLRKLRQYALFRSLAVGFRLDYGSPRCLENLELLSVEASVIDIVVPTYS